MTVTRQQIERLLNISRTTFNAKYKPFVKQVPSITHVNLYDLESVMEWHKKRPKGTVGRPKKAPEKIKA